MIISPGPVRSDVVDAVNRVNAVGEARDAGGHEVLIAEVTDAWAGAGLAKAIHLVVGR